MCDGLYPKTFPEVKGTLENFRKQKYGKAPINCEEIKREFEKPEIFEYLGRSRHRERGIFFNTVQFGDGFENCIFSSEKCIALIKENVTIEDRFFIMDATFRITARGIFMQSLIIHAQFGNKTFPIVFVLMSRKTTNAYYSVLKYVHENLIPLVGSGIIIDFEKAERLAISRLNTGIVIYGCWFHFCQALRRKLASLGELFELVRMNDEAKTIFSQFQCLALLPADMIEDAFKKLSKKALKISLLFAQFIDYFDKEWIKIVKPKHFSVFMRGTRTTGSAESYNHLVNQRFKTHGNFFHFCETLQSEEVVIATQLENYVTGTIQRDKQPKYLKKRHKNIWKYSKMLKNGDIKPMLFLAIMANSKNHIVYADSDISMHEKEIQMSSEKEYFGNADNVVYQEFDDSSSDSENDDTDIISTRGAMSPSPSPSTASSSSSGSARQVNSGPVIGK